MKIRKRFLRGTLPVVRLLPLPTAARIVSGIGRFEHRLNRALRLRFDEAVARGGRILGCDWDVPAVSNRLAGNHILWRSRDLLVDVPSNARALGMFDVEGREHLDAARALGKGCIVLTSHFGAHMLPAHWLYRNDYPVKLYMEKPRSLSKFMASRFDHEGPLSQDKLFISRKGDASDAASSILRAARVLKSGMLLFLAGDVRWSGQLTTTARFLDRRYTFSTTWIALAAMTQAPVVPVFCRVGEDSRYHMQFHPHFVLPRDAQDEAQAGGHVQGFLDQLQDQIRRYPADSNEYLFWGDEYAAA
ncbi:lysophospholipid acyltransferase family protein [Paludisphaera mucosa]|uniref:Lysophospholipid acyltransferase family protein n=1 Tax=Paludisphaera mucosa TaxID=3030827 RepID=A0ABT6F5C2_9BACT|nr:lysophospholipid acyltransferase family protein [Paludisphaera mucosa]